MSLVMSPPRLFVSLKGSNSEQINARVNASSPVGLELTLLVMH